jgi:hypothetical protein
MQLEHADVVAVGAIDRPADRMPLASEAPGHLHPNIPRRPRFLTVFGCCEGAAVARLDPNIGHDDPKVHFTNHVIPKLDNARDRSTSRQYVSLGLTFHHGAVDLGSGPHEIPVPPVRVVESTLGEPSTPVLSDLHADLAEPVRRWLDAPATMRLVGPAFDPDEPSKALVSGGSLAQWFESLVHVGAVGPSLSSPVPKRQTPDPRSRTDRCSPCATSDLTPNRREPDERRAHGTCARDAKPALRTEDIPRPRSARRLSVLRLPVGGPVPPRRRSRRPRRRRAGHAPRSPAALPVRKGTPVAAKPYDLNSRPRLTDRSARVVRGDGSPAGRGARLQP